MATHSSILAWRVPWTEEPGGLQPMGSQKSWTLSDCIITTTKQETYLNVKRVTYVVIFNVLFVSE